MVWTTRLYQVPVTQSGDGCPFGGRPFWSPPFIFTVRHPLPSAFTVPRRRSGRSRSFQSLWSRPPSQFSPLGLPVDLWSFGGGENVGCGGALRELPRPCHNRIASQPKPYCLSHSYVIYNRCISKHNDGAELFAPWKLVCTFQPWFINPSNSMMFTIQEPSKLGGADLLFSCCLYES